MRAVYRTSFELRPATPEQDLFASFSEAVWRWVYDRQGVGLSLRPAEAVGPVTLARCSAGKAIELEALEANLGDRRAWGLSLKHTEPNGRMFWVSELALSENEQGARRFSFSQLVGKNDGSLAPVQRAPGRPRIIKTLVNDFQSVSGGLRLLGKPFTLDEKEENLDRLMHILEAPERTHPVVFVSIHTQSERPLIKVSDLADHLCGLAQVIVAKDAGVSLAWAARLPQWHTCFDGAIRIYWPGFRRTSQAARHPLWTAQDLADEVNFESSRFADRVLASIADVSVYGFPPDFCSWEQLQSMDRRRAIERAKENQDWQPLTEQLYEDNAAKEAELVRLRQQLREVNESLFQERQITSTYRQVLGERKAGKTSVAEDQLPVETVAEAIERAQKCFGEQLGFALNSRSEPGSPFHAPEEVFLAFEWLATVYRESRLGRKSITDFDRHLSENISGWHYAGHQKEATMKAHEAWYRCVWQGNKIWIPEHLKSGSSRDSEESIRIAFAWDEASGRVVIGYLGQHQRNSKT